MRLLRRNNLFLSIFVTLLLFVGIMAFANIVQRDPYFGWHTYQIKQFDISFKIPPGWHAEIKEPYVHGNKKGPSVVGCDDIDTPIRDHSICSKDQNTYVAAHADVEDGIPEITGINIVINFGVLSHVTHDDNPLIANRKTIPVVIGGKSYQLETYEIPKYKDWQFYLNNIETGPKSPIAVFHIAGNGSPKINALKKILMSIKQGV